VCRLTYAIPSALARGRLITRTLGCCHASSKEALLPNQSGTGFEDTEDLHESTIE
jgi:hypothetical protein